MSLTSPSSSYRVCPTCHAVFRSPFAGCPWDGSSLQPLIEDPLLGVTIAERYVVEAFVGEGGMGRVYRSRHARTGRKFALKVLFGEMAADARMRQRFAREAETASTLDHPNVVPVLDFGETPAGLSYIAMDFVEGVALNVAIRYESPMQLDRVIRIARDIASGLSHAHEKGLVHRDLKPDNVILVKNGEREVPRIVDFGLAIRAEDMGGSRVTTGRVFFGTPAYMAPEQARVLEVVDGRADLYSLGVTIYEMATGRPPFEGEALDVLAAAFVAERPPMSGRFPGLVVPQPLEALVRRLLDPERDRRPPSAQAVIEALDQIGASLGRVSSPSVPTQRVAEQLLSGEPTVPVADPARRRRLVVVAALAGFFLALGGAFFARRALREPAAAVIDTPDAGLAIVALAPPDAAPVETPVDAGTVVVAIEPPDAGRRVGPSRPRVVASPPDAGPKVVEKPAEPPEEKLVPPPAGPGTVEAFSARYRKVGAALDALARAKGKPVAEPLRKRYFAIPFSDALREPSLRADAVQKLWALEQEIRAAAR